MIESFSNILKDAQRGHYAVGAFNCFSLEQARGAIEAAEEAKSPIILQVAEIAELPDLPPIELMAPFCLELAAKASVPACLHLDHGKTLETCVKAIKLGFNSIMFDGAALPFEENVRLSAICAKMSHGAGCDYEAELGKVGDAWNVNDKADVFTDVEESARFIELTGIDALAIAIGNQHGKYVATPKLNIDRLKEIAARNPETPLVLHGGSGTSIEDFKACVHNGICKVNVATALHTEVVAAIKQYVDTCPNPTYDELRNVIIRTNKAAVLRHMEIFESVGKA